MAVGDLNGDNKPDLVVTNSYYGAVSILFNNGDGTFGSPVTYGVASYYPNSVALGDVNNDGTCDIVLGSLYNYCYSAGVVSVMLNNGDGSFGPSQNFESGYYTNQVALGDLSHDGNLDIVTANLWGGSLSVLLHQSPPTLELIAPDGTTVLASSSPTNSYDAAIVDFTATEDGTYYIRVSATASPVDYTLVVTRNADLPDPASGNSPALLASSTETPVGDGEAGSSGAKLLGTSDAAYPWSNQIQPADVSNDGYVSPVDVLMIINSLNTEVREACPWGSRAKWHNRSTM